MKWRCKDFCWCIFYWTNCVGRRDTDKLLSLKYSSSGLSKHTEILSLFPLLSKQLSTKCPSLGLEKQEQLMVHANPPHCRTSLFALFNCLITSWAQQSIHQISSYVSELHLIWGELPFGLAQICLPWLVLLQAQGNMPRQGKLNANGRFFVLLLLFLLLFRR